MAPGCSLFQIDLREAGPIARPLVERQARWRGRHSRKRRLQLSVASFTASTGTSMIDRALECSPRPSVLALPVRGLVAAIDGKAGLAAAPGDRGGGPGSESPRRRRRRFFVRSAAVYSSISRDCCSSRKYIARNSALTTGPVCVCEQLDRDLRLCQAVLLLQRVANRRGQQPIDAHQVERHERRALAGGIFEH